MAKQIFVAAIAAAALATGSACADRGNVGRWGDDGNGRYTNPVIPADYSDIDCIRVGRWFYAISSTFQFCPGMVILRSKDLVNWSIAGHAVDNLTQISPALSWKQMNRYGRGIWAGSIRYHAGRFWIYFGTPNEGYFMTTARKVSGPWSPLHHVLKGPGWDDPCPFWDANGQGYLVGTSFKQKYKIHLFKLSANGQRLLPGFDRVIHQSRGSEANKLYKWHGYYCHVFSQVQREGRVVMMERSRSLAGPWQEHQLNHVNRQTDLEPNQGGIVRAPGGKWWFFTQQGTGTWAGREDCLLPVTWIHGWPIIGKPGPDGIGRMVWTDRKPVAGCPVTVIATSDQFNGPALGPQWEWNYQPRDSKWSLAQRPGWLRLHAFRPLVRGDLLKAGNTLTQRSLQAKHCVVTIRLDVRHMANGQRAGLCHFSKASSSFGVIRRGGVNRLFLALNRSLHPGPRVTAKIIWLRSTWGQQGISAYSYSLDGQHFQRFGPTCRLSWGYYRGDRIGIFTFNDKTTAGYVDVDYFQYTFIGPQGRTYGKLALDSASSPSRTGPRGNKQP